MQMFNESSDLNFRLVAKNRSWRTVNTIRRDCKPTYKETANYFDDIFTLISLEK